MKKSKQYIVCLHMMKQFKSYVSPYYDDFGGIDYFYFSDNINRAFKFSDLESAQSYVDRFHKRNDPDAKFDIIEV